MVNILSMFCQEFQKLLKPIYNLTRRGGQFIWVREQQEAFKEIKHRIIKAPILYMPNCEGRFHLYPDMSKFATGSALYQIQNGKPKLIAYASKRLPEAVRSYSIMELELCGLVINIASFSHLLKRVDFDVIVDHLALTYIIKSKAEPATTRIKRLLELISSHSFNLYYMKGKDMISSGFLLRWTHDDSDPHDIIPISFNMHNTLHKRYYKIETKERYLVQMHSQTKSSGVILPEVHGSKKILDTNLLPEKQKVIPQIKKVIENKLKLEQGRAGMRCRKPQLRESIMESTSKSHKIPKIPTTQNVAKNRMDFPAQEQSITNNTEAIRRGMIQHKNRELPFNPDLIYRPPPRPPENLQPQNSESKAETSPKIDIEFKENSPYQEGIISKAYQRPDKSYFQEPKELESLVNMSRLVQKFIPKQTDIDKILKIIQ